MFLCLGLMGGGRMAKYTSFRPAKNSALAPSTPESNWAYFTAATGTAWTAPADSEITFNGTDWLTVSGSTPAGAKRWKVRGLASADHNTLVTYTPTLGGVDWPFAITTHVEEGIEHVMFGGDPDVTLGGEGVIW